MAEVRAFEASRALAEGQHLFCIALGRDNNEQLELFPSFLSPMKHLRRSSKAAPLYKNQVSHPLQKQQILIFLNFAVRQ